MLRSALRCCRTRTVTAIRRATEPRGWGNSAVQAAEDFSWVEQDRKHANEEKYARQHERDVIANALQRGKVFPSTGANGDSGDAEAVKAAPLDQSAPAPNHSNSNISKTPSGSTGEDLSWSEQDKKHSNEEKYAREREHEVIEESLRLGRLSGSTAVYGARTYEDEPVGRSK